MTRIQHSINSPHTKPWIERIGKIVLNFSALELESILWLVQLSEQLENAKKFVEMPFAARVTQVMRHVEARGINAQWRKASLRAWNDALKLALIRNQVAHNPIVFGWNSSSETGEPDFIGVPNFRVAKSAKNKPLLAKAGADKCINDAVLLATRLASLRAEWCAVRDEGNAPAIQIKPSYWYTLKRRAARFVRAMIGSK